MIAVGRGITRRAERQHTYWHRGDEGSPDLVDLLMFSKWSDTIWTVLNLVKHYAFHTSTCIVFAHHFIMFPHSRHAAVDILLNEITTMPLTLTLSACFHGMNGFFNMNFFIWFIIFMNVAYDCISVMTWELILEKSICISSTSLLKTMWNKGQKLLALWQTKWRCDIWGSRSIDY
jgi:hypothetical protein